MSDSTTTLNELWLKLGLDSLPGDAGAKDDLRSTRTVDWDASTLRVTRETPTERVDLPRISISPPAFATSEATAAHNDLVVVGVLGEGGMGKVLLSRQQSLGRDVAVKVARGDASPGSLQALVHEARTTGALEHPGVIPVYALASDVQGRPALVMKRVDGVSWGRLLYDEHDAAWERLGHRGGDTLERHVDILLHVCNAIAFAHSKGVLHRDLKPSNVLIGEFGEVYVADWGVATRKVKAGEQRKPSLVGTPVYMAPEMVTGDDSLMDERTDVFLLGATLFEVLAGRPPFGGEDLRAVLTNAWEGRREPLPASAPRELCDICDHAMAPPPSARFQTVTELRDALIGWVRHKGSVSLARAAQERLDQLLDLLRSGSKDRGVILPLLSECRFGFGQALKEWPENELASEGLRDSIEAAARFEASQGNLEAARALCKELAKVPKDLELSLERLEQSAQARAAREARFAHLEKELDPRVSFRQRMAFMLVMAGATAIIITTTRFWGPGREFVASLGAFAMPVLMMMYFGAYLISLWVGRESLFATRLNRRASGIVGLAILGPMFNRFFAAFTGATQAQTQVSDMVATAVMTAAAGMMMHPAFFVCTAAYLVGAALAVVFPAQSSLVHAIAAMVAIVAVVGTMNRWRNEFSLTQREKKPRKGKGA